MLYRTIRVVACYEARYDGLSLFIFMAGRLQARSKPQLLLSMSSALRAHCFSAARG